MSDKSNNLFQSHNWFSSIIEYQGYGRAEFQKPQGYIEGSVKINFDGLGNSIIEMKIEKYETEQSLQFGLIEFLSSENPVEEEDKVRFSGLPDTNPCQSLTVTTQQGTYSAIGDIIYNSRVDLLGVGGSSICFYLIQSQFDGLETGQAKYWVLPLVNFISDFSEHCQSLEDHPLRFSNIKSLITFEFNGTLGFIEPLPDFNIRKNNLLSGKIQRTITAVMVGEIGLEPINVSNFKEKLPFEFIALLSLATGIEVSNSWIELRDVNGLCVQRIHDYFYQPCFSKGHTAITEVGYFLTKSQSSTFYGQAPLGPVLVDLVRGGLDSLTIEDQLSQLCRALDHLCKHYQLSCQKLLNGLNETHENLVKDTLRTASQTLREAARNTSDQQKQLLFKIAERINNAANKDRDFGLAVVDLLKQFNLPDADIINSHYRANPRTDQIETWSGVLSYYRGAAVHVGYFGNQPEQYNIQDLVKVTKHLHDLLIRIVLKMLDYDKTYQPAVTKICVNKLVSWVTPNISAIELGY